MTSERLNQYFADEAADYLEQLHTLLDDGSQSPEPTRFLRLASGVRGSTKMAGAGSIARLAGRLEEAAISIASARVTWTDHLRAVARETVTDIQSLVDLRGSWGPEEERRVEESYARWNDIKVDGPLDSRPVVPIDALYYDDAGPHVLGSESAFTGAGNAVVPIESLLLEGADALQEAIRLRLAFEALARGDAAPDRTLPDLVHELFDLLDLAQVSKSPEA